jgi:hypothetical protein
MAEPAACSPSISFACNSWLLFNAFIVSHLTWRSSLYCSNSKNTYFVSRYLYK